MTASRDGTMQKRSGQPPKEPKGMLQGILDHVPVMISLRDRRGQLRFVNKEWKRMLGRPPQGATLGDSLARWFPDPEKRQEVLGHVLAATGEWYDAQPIAPDGRSLKVSCADIRLADGASICVAHDVTRQKEVERLVAARDRRFRALIENSSELIVLVDVAGRLMEEWTSSGARRLGYDAGELRGRCMFDYAHPEDLRRIQEEFRQLLQRPGETARLEFRFLHKDGSWREVEATAANLAHLPEVAGVVANCRDVTDRKQAEEQLRVSQERLRQLAAYVVEAREEERTRIAREMHDELGQTLSALRMSLEDLAADCSSNRATRAAIGRGITSVVDRLRTSIDSVKRICAELRPGVLDHFGLAAAIEWQAQEFQSATGIKCSIKEMPENLHLPADRSTAVFRTFQEILTNVARHSRASRACVRLRTGPKGLTLAVRDNGIGMRKRQADDPRSLGLLGMKERAQLLGGTIQFKGVRGKGTTVTLRFPASTSS